MNLYIDTTDYNKIIFAVLDGKKLKKKIYKITSYESHKILQKLEEFLKAIHYPLSTIHSLVVNKGPGSFTGTRVGVTIGQALSLALGVPVKFVAKEKFKISTPLV
jgi:tRNA threonylcarbamoyladenosine biosynthesis protein TsaB